MKIQDLFEETTSALTANKMRSSLTILGIVIGIASVIAMVAIGTGSQSSIDASIQAIGSNLIMVMPGFQRGAASGPVSAGRGAAQTLTQADADAIQSQVASIKAIAPELSKRYQITASGNNTNTTVTGTASAYPEVRNIQMDIGSFISDENIASLSKVAVLGPTTRDDLFGTGADPTGQQIRINNVSFTVIGVTKSKGGTGFSNQDDVVFVPISTAETYLSGNSNAYVSEIDIEAANQSAMASIQTQVTNLLLSRHNITNPTLADFQVLNQQDIVNSASSVTNTFTILLASIAGISLVVGGIGIMNMMLTTVTERTREIGLRKAIGADETDINMQFLTESFMLTLIGGIIGIILGWVVAWGMAQFAGITTQVSLTSIVLAFGVSAVIGIVFGYYPARRASKLNPIEALRYE
jgi:putative ABC transport system permease protein